VFDRKADVTVNRVDDPRHDAYLVLSSAPQSASLADSEHASLRHPAQYTDEQLIVSHETTVLDPLLLTNQR
jgi:hypothetical protein